MVRTVAPKYPMLARLRQLRVALSRSGTRSPARSVSSASSESLMSPNARAVPEGLEALVSGWPARHTQDVEWGTLDAFGHLNNVLYFRFMENGRFSFFHEMQRRVQGERAAPSIADFVQGRGCGPILKSTGCTFRAPLYHPETVTVATRVPEESIDEDRFVLQHRIFRHSDLKLVAEGEGVVVCFDYDRKGKAPLPADIVQVLQELAKDGQAA